MVFVRFQRSLIPLGAFETNISESTKSNERIKKYMAPPFRERGIQAAMLQWGWQLPGGGAAEWNATRGGDGGVRGGIR
jgi:hypothetical protein